MKDVENLLTQVAIINKKNAEILDAIGGRFNMFQLCGVNHYENTHSAIIAEFLNPNGTHGLKSKLLECFIETLGDNFTIQYFNYEKAQVFTEYTTENGRIDILIEDSQNNKAIIIENKIYANDQTEQLKRYNEFAQKSKNDYQILYLTLLGNNASNQSGEGVPYLTISYKENIINWLEKCVSICAKFPLVRETIIQYINHLKQLTNQDMDAHNKEEITEVLSKIENLKAAQVIYQNYAETFNYLAKHYFNPEMEKFARLNGLEFHYEKSEESYIRFYLTNSKWQGKCWIKFTFENNNCQYGLFNPNPNIYMISVENRESLHEHLSKLKITPLNPSNWWPFYSHFSNLTLDTWENDIIKSKKL